MGLLTRSGKYLFLAVTLVSAVYAQATPLVCIASAVPELLRAESVSERTGDVVLGCTGGTSGALVTGNLNLLLPVNITNRVTPDSVATGVTLSIDSGSGFQPSGISGRVTGQSISFNGISFNLPASGTASVRVSNLRINVSQMAVAAQQQVRAHIATSLSTLAGSNPVTVGLVQPGLLATLSSAGIPCAGSPLPSTIDLDRLFRAQTIFASTRFTEGFATAFRKKDPTSDAGTRIIARYSGFPAGARVFVPDVIAGSSAVEPTAAGDLGLAQSGGRYAPGGSGSLLLVRVLAPDANGASGLLVYTPGAPGSGTVAFNGASEVTLASGAGQVIYEVVDADPGQRESAQFPTFVSMPAASTVTFAREILTFAPVSTESAASTLAPVPRFAPVEPSTDCPALGDCDSDFFPRLSVIAQPVVFFAIQGGAAFDSGYIPVRNEGGGVMPWTATVAYQNGIDWLKLEPASGINNGSIRVWASPQKLAVGTYQATIRIEAGALVGSRTVPVTLTVTALPAPPAPPDTPPTPPEPPATPVIVISGVTNAADFHDGPVAPGSIATLTGSHLSGRGVSVTFDGIPARLLSAGDERINLLVPAELGARTSAQVVVTAGASSSAAYTVELAAVAPAIFAGGVLNQDSTVNSTTAPAAVGSVLQIFLTGLPATGGAMVKIHDREDLVPLYDGAAPGLEGIVQVNVAVPDDLPAMTTSVLVCARAGDRKVCSWPAPLTLR